MVARILRPFLALVLVACGLTFAAISLSTQERPRTIAERLGHPAGAKLLIIHADDVGVAHSVNRATFQAFEEKSISSASIMVPCPWFTEVANYAKAHPEADLGLHLTLTSEWLTYRWGPVSSKDKVRGLLDPFGYFWPGNSQVVKSASPEEVEQEIREQVQQALRAGINVSHLDTHMGTLAATPAFYAALVKVSREFGLPFMALRMPGAPPAMLSLLRETDIVLDNLAMATERVQAGQWNEYYAGVIRSLKPGLTELIVHLGYDDDELKAVMAGKPAYGSAWRQRDMDVISSPEFKQLLKDNRVVLINWGDLKKLLPRPVSGTTY